MNERPLSDAWASWTRAATLQVSAEARELEDGTRAIRVVAGAPSAPIAEGWSRRDFDSDEAPSLTEALRELADKLDALELEGAAPTSRVVATMRSRVVRDAEGGRRARNA
ncbi:MAG: hypothetical protein MUE69_31950 [Myxococcota bacterium]|jgi:hypothetical protein|nr:hypothetical protein [Myxococcota bacterium]